MAFSILAHHVNTTGNGDYVVQNTTTSAIIDGGTISFDGGSTFQPYTYLGLGGYRGGTPTAEFIEVGGQTYAWNANNPTGSLPTGNWKIGVGDLDPSNPPCFVAGTMILTPDGERPVEELREGDEVVTSNNSVRRILWVGGRRFHPSAFDRNPEIRPIRIAAGAIGNARDLIVSPQHRILISGAHAEILFGEKEVLVPAKGLLNGDRVHFSSLGEEVTYFHILLEEHDIVMANGVPAESLYLGDQMSEGILKEMSLLVPGFERLRLNQKIACPGLSVKEAIALAH